MIEGWRYITAATCLLSGYAALTSGTAHAMEMEPATTIIAKQPTPVAPLPMAPSGEMSTEFRPSLADQPEAEPLPMPSRVASPSEGDGAQTSWSTTLTRAQPAAPKQAGPSLAAGAPSLIVPLPVKARAHIAAANAPAPIVLPAQQDKAGAAGPRPSVALVPTNQPATSPVPAHITAVVATPAVFVHREIGMASFYRGEGQTASGAKAGGMTAAHRKLPFGSRVKVKDVRTGKEVVVTIIDRGPFKKSRVIDLSHMAARELGITGRGIARVEVVSVE